MTEAEQTPTTLVTPVGELPQHAGIELGPSAWREVTQDNVDRFADATDDHQWIHDAEHAVDGPFGAPIAHGYYTLALMPRIVTDLLEVNGASMCINCGVDAVRFLGVLYVGTRVRGTAALADVSTIPGGVETTIAVALEAEGDANPICVAKMLLRYYA